jgi:phosphoribosylformylglycinamidine (FGAM) synthase-like enzyme
VVAVVGLVDRLDAVPPGARLVDGTSVVLVGSSDDTAALSGSVWAWRQGFKAGSLPRLDLDAHRQVCDTVRSLVADGRLAGVHDVGDGGVGVALAEMAIAGGVGCTVDAPSPDADHHWLFSEAPGRFVIAVDDASLGEVERRCREAGVAVTPLGKAGGERLTITGLVDVPLSQAHTTWKNRLPAALGQGTAQ